MNNKKKKIFIVVLLFILMIIGYFFLMPKLSFKKEEKILEKGFIYKANDFILNSKGEVIPENEYLNTQEMGTYEFHYKVKRYIFTKDYILKYEVIDTIAPRIEIKNKNIINGIGKAYTYEDMKNNIIIDEGEIEIDTDYDKDKIGSYIIKIIVKDDADNMAEDYFIAEVIEDNEAPIIFRSGDGAKILKDSIFDINDIISYGDNFDPKPQLNIIGEVDTSKIGSYLLEASLKDYVDNEIKWQLNVEVVEELPEDIDDDYYYAFESFINDYKTDDRKLGIDISSWQGDIDFKKVKEAGCEFIIIRIGYSFKGELTLDKKFKQNIIGATNEEIPIGIYLFSYENNKEDLLSSLDQVFKELEGYKLDLPLAFDWENFGNYQDYEISFKELNELYDIFEEEVTKKGYECILYGSKNYLLKAWSKLDKRPIWLAQYNSWPNYDGQYKIWQLSEDGRIDGINERVDFDIIFN